MPEFGERIDRGILEHAPIREASGIAASRQNADVLWTHNDSDRGPRIFALSATGKHLAVYRLAGASCRDWEDIAIGTGPAANTQYIYIGNIGDNLSRYDLKYIYRVPEPVVRQQRVEEEITLGNVETITFRFPDGNRDAETLMLDPSTRDIYIVSKREEQVRVYVLPFPQSISEVSTAEAVATLDMLNVVGGDISPSGDELLLKTYGHVYYWQRSAAQPLREVFAQRPIRVPYIPEPQGEAVCWEANGSGYFTTSEEFASLPAHLFYYPRLNTPAN